MNFVVDPLGWFLEIMPQLIRYVDKTRLVKAKHERSFRKKRYQSLELVTFDTRALPRRNGPQGSLEVH
jgi:hypothetical protein